MRRRNKKRDRNMKNENISGHYDEAYFEWERKIGEFGAWADKDRFNKYITPEDVVLEFGCGGGFLLKEINCRKRLGVEINPAAIKVAQKNGIKIYTSTEEVYDNSIDVIISTNALEHTLRPLDELKKLYNKLKIGGKVIFLVPCESISYKYKPNDINHHLYSWSPMCIGNLFTEAGFKVIEVNSDASKWPPHAELVAKIAGRFIFNIICKIYGSLRRSFFSVRIIATK